jgi:Holliday junction resolvasome RuvABC endonuclease subunit
MTPIDKFESKKTILVIDPSASHLAFGVAVIDPSRFECSIVNCGMLWTNSKWSLGTRLNYMRDSIKTLIRHFNIDHIFTEQFFINPALLSGGTAVVPTINSIIQMCIADEEKQIDYTEIPPPSWRAILGIKHVYVQQGEGKKPKRDYKEPTKQYVLKHIKVPDTINSNITNKLRDTPYDIFDMLAILLAISQEHEAVTLSAPEKVFYDQEILLKLKCKDDNIYKTKGNRNG